MCKTFLFICVFILSAGMLIEDMGPFGGAGGDCYAQGTQIVSDTATSVLDTNKIDGVYFGVTFKRDVQLANTQLEAGWLKQFSIGWVAFAGEYDQVHETYGPALNYYTKLQDRIWFGGGAGLNFSGSSFNRTGDLRVMFAYVPDRTILGMKLAFIPRYQITGYVDTGGASADISSRILSDDRGSELWLSIVFLGF